MRKRYTILFLVLICLNIDVIAQVGINTTTPNAALDIEASNATSPSSSDGLLIPRIEAFPSTDPGFDQNGMLVYLISTDGTNDPGFYYWDGVSSTWTSIGSGSSSGDAWDIQGNSGTNTISNFLGTTDNVGLVFRTNNTAKLRITTSGQLETLNTGNSIFIGTSAGASDDLTSNNNVFIGYQAAQNADTGNDNIAIGRQAGQNIASGAENIAIGRQALQNIGDGAGNIAIGHNAGATAGLFTSSPDATLWIENSAGSSPLIGGDFANNRVGINVDLSNLTNLTHTLTVNGDIYASSDIETAGGIIATSNIETSGNIEATGGILATGDIETGGEFITPTNTYPDYVFEGYYNGASEILPSYSFKSLAEVEEFIKTNGHLPGVKSYEEVKAEDFKIELGVTSITNLEKIEESFLYIIELNKKIEAQEEELKYKDNKIEDLEKRLEKIEALLAK